MCKNNTPWLVPVLSAVRALFVQSKSAPYHIPMLSQAKKGPQPAAGTTRRHIKSPLIALRMQGGGGGKLAGSKRGRAAAQAPQVG
jgi:hypothetical protein